MNKHVGSSVEDFLKEEGIFMDDISMPQRLFTFVLATYLSDRQHGIQSLHALGELVVKYHKRKQGLDAAVLSWADKYKTVVVLDGGMKEDMENIEAMFAEPLNPFPWAVFKEPELNNVPTIAIILPEYVYCRPQNAPEELDVWLDHQNFQGEEREWFRRLAGLLNGCPRARS